MLEAQHTEAQFFCLNSMMGYTYSPWIFKGSVYRRELKKLVLNKKIQFGQV